MNKFCAGRLNATAFNSLQYGILVAILTPLILLVEFQPGSAWSVLMAIIYGVCWVPIGAQIFYYLLECAPAHIVVPISNSTSVWAVIFSALLLGESLTLAVPVSLLFIIVGVALMSPKREPGAKRAAAFIILLSVIDSAIFGLTQVARKSAVTQGIGPITFLWIAGVTGVSLLAVVGLIRRSFRGQMINRYGLGVSFTAGVGQVAGGILFLMALALEKASTLAPVMSSTVAFGFLLSIPLLHERPTKRAAVGAAIVFAGVIIATL